MQTVLTSITIVYTLSIQLRDEEYMETPQRSVRFDDNVWEYLNEVSKNYTTDFIKLDRTEVLRLMISYFARDEKLLEKVCRGMV